MIFFLTPVIRNGLNCNRSSCHEQSRAKTVVLSLLVMLLRTIPCCSDVVLSRELILRVLDGGDGAIGVVVNGRTRLFFATRERDANCERCGDECQSCHGRMSLLSDESVEIFKCDQVARENFFPFAHSYLSQGRNTETEINGEYSETLRKHCEIVQGAAAKKDPGQGAR